MSSSILRNLLEIPTKPQIQHVVEGKHHNVRRSETSIGLHNFSYSEITCLGGCRRRGQHATEDLVHHQTQVDPRSRGEVRN